MKLNLKERKGITLIALVITIIVLLILAGVSIAMLTGQNGILTQAQNSKQATEKAEVKERAQTDIVGVQTETESTEISKTALKRILDKYFDNVPNDIKSDTEITAKAEYGGAKMKVSDIYSGEIIEKRYMAADIANATQEEKQSIYGATVTGYTLPSETTTDVGWKIFYADNSNIYLIADNYVERNNLPNSTTESGVVTANKPNDGYSHCARSAYFTNILGDYAGSSRITDSRLKALNNDYFNTKNYSSTDDNMKAVAYMMDTKAWNSKFLDSNKADYCIGGPSVELLFKSYNEKYKTAYESQASNDAGYQIRKTSSDSWGNFVSSMLSTSDPLYVITSTSNAYGYWLASSSARTYGSVMSVACSGNVTDCDYRYDYFDYGTGFRPLVCLNSNIKLQKVSDTQYAIQ